MIPNNNLSVLPWYSDKRLQNHNKSYAYGNVYPLYVPKDKLIPFQIIVDNAQTALSTIPIASTLNANTSFTTNAYFYENFNILGGARITKLRINCHTAGTVSIIKASGVNSPAYTSSVLETINLTAGFNEISVDYLLASGETIGFGAPSNTAIFNYKTGEPNPVGGRIYGRNHSTGVWQLFNNDLSIGIEYISNDISIIVHNCDNSFTQDITSELKEVGLSIFNFSSLGYDVIVFPGILPFNSNIKEGLHYLELTRGENKFYSEIFTVVNNVDNLLKIEWFDVDDFVFDAGRIVYSNSSFKNILYLCTEIGKPEYIFEEDGETRDGYFFAEKQISEKTYKFTFLAPEYLCDVIRLIRMSDYIHITDMYNRLYKCDTFLITPKWQTQGDLASVEAEFQTATVVKKIGRGYINPNSGDFNNDFSNDFNN